MVRKGKSFRVPMSVSLLGQSSFVILRTGHHRLEELLVIAVLGMIGANVLVSVMTQHRFHFTLPFDLFLIFGNRTF
jgi:hypothetical protein